jgi:hypothetical protein
MLCPYFSEILRLIYALRIAESNDEGVLKSRQVAGMDQGYKKDAYLCPEL